MTFPFSFATSSAVVISAALMLGLTGCRKPKSAATSKLRPDGVVAAELKSNALGSLPGAVFRTQADSPIHWQAWSPETLARAKQANRLIFGVIVIPQHPGFQSILENLSRDSATVEAINETYVPVLIDGDASRELGLLSGDLCAEIRRGIQLPLFVWMSPEGSPVAWIPVARTTSAKLVELFNQSHSMVAKMWADDPEYVVKNSALDNQNRRERLSKRKNSIVMSMQPAEDTIRGLRQLTSLYDPFSRTFDEAGGVFPAGVIDLLATAAVHPGLSEELRASCLETVKNLMQDLLPSAMFDPLEGGVFTSRRGISWALPSFNRDCGSQARAAIALIHAYRATGDLRTRDQALALISFAESQFLTSDGLFSVGLITESEPANWLWSVDDIKKTLSSEDAVWWMKATGMKEVGNLPSESDPGREYFRKNSMGLIQTVEEIASEQSLSVEAFAQRFEAAKKMLLKTRNQRIREAKRDNSPHAGVTFRMVSAYAAAYGVTGDENFRKSAIQLMEKAQETFYEGTKLRLYPQEMPVSVGAARAFVYGLALQSALDLADITSDEKWLGWAEDVSTTAAEKFTGDGLLKECPDDANLMNLPVTDLIMLFDDSTAGLISFAECRLAARNRPMPRSFSELATPLPNYTTERPVLHTDLLQATLARHFRVTVVRGANLSDEMEQVIDQLPMRMIQRRDAKSKDEVPEGSVMIILENVEPLIISTPEALRQAVLPSPKKS